MQHPGGKRMGPIKNLFDDFKNWLHSRACEAEIQGYYEHLEHMRNGLWREWYRPITFSTNKQIDDGKHRLVAAYEHWKQTESEFEIEVYWGRCR